MDTVTNFLNDLPGWLRLGVAVVAGVFILWVLGGVVAAAVTRARDAIIAFSTPDVSRPAEREAFPPPPPSPPPASGPYPAAPPSPPASPQAPSRSPFGSTGGWPQGGGD